MVFLSTVQALLGRPLSRNVFAFGTRQLDRVMIVEEIAMGLFLVFPLSMLLAALTIRVAAKSIPWMRCDIYTTLLITIVGDVFLEILLPSLQCLPMNQALVDDDMDYRTWLAQSWGFACPTNLTHDQLLSTDAVGTLLTVRLIFMCLGVYLGEAFIPVALTGGIASGKSTVAKMLLDPKRLYTQRSTRRRKQKSTTGSSGSASNAASTSGTASHSLLPDADDEGSFDVIDVDRIAHEVLLPPSVLKGDDPSPTVDPPYTTPPKYSLYKQILQVFDGHDILDETNLIDRRKLGGIIFQDSSLRLQLNRLTHPRILFVMMQKIVRGIFLGSKDIVCADIPLLFESGQLKRLFALTICVAASKELQFERLRKRNPELGEQECWNRINSQMAVDEKVKLADITVWNTGDMDALSEEVEKLRREVIGRIFGVGMSLLQMLLLVGGSLSLAVSSKLFS